MDSKVSLPIVRFFTMKILLLVLIIACNIYPSIPSPDDYSDYPNPTTLVTPPSGSGTETDANCPKNVATLGVCANVLNGLLGLTVGNQSVEPCCSLIQGLVALKAAACLCTSIQANILGYNLNVPLSINMVLDLCGLQQLPGFQCA